MQMTMKEAFAKGSMKRTRTECGGDSIAPPEKKARGQDTLYNKPAMSSKFKFVKKDIQDLYTCADDLSCHSDLALRNQPRVGDVYIYANITEEKLRVAHTDTEEWRHSGGVRKTFYGQAEIIRTQAIGKKINEFRKTTYYFTAKKFAAVHYHEVGHGNGHLVREASKKNSHEEAAGPKLLDHFIATPQYSENQSMSIAEAKKRIRVQISEKTTLPSNLALINNPKAGDIYVFKLNSPTFQTSYEHITHDGQRWKILPTFSRHLQT